MLYRSLGDHVLHWIQHKSVCIVGEADGGENCSEDHVRMIHTATVALLCTFGHQTQHDANEHDGEQIKP